MPNRRDEQADRDFFEAKYSRHRSSAARQVERLALGHEVGLNGYTTVPEAQILSDQLLLRPGNLLLEVGAGRGWPGSYIARAHGARLISTDIPLDALLEAKENTAAGVVAADGRALPLQTGGVRAIVHADVLC